MADTVPSVAFEEVKEDGKLSGTITSASTDKAGTYTLTVKKGDDVITSGEFDLKAAAPKPQLDQIAAVTVGATGPVSGANFAAGHDYTGEIALKA
ncbi:hypothetical protein [Streptomyces sp. 769]|uniref:hypothetical protein n=1 Tax=Streptomyces sp. 769 TaxID=1262452 RepID=UPI000580833B|nr:hypothetical protein [Streptomyces sp. 769]AJC53998.1 hypothetical protein GZL_01398 [Streptomyces sp. 769]